MIGVTALNAQTVVHCPSEDQPLSARWKWANDEAAKGNAKAPYWIGYSFTKMMGVDSWTGTFYSDRSENRHTLCELIGLQPCIKKEWSHDGVHTTIMSDCSEIIDGEADENRLVEKEVAVLFEMSGGEIQRIRTTNVSLEVELSDDPIYWLGKANDSASVLLLQSLYTDKSTENVKKGIVSSVGLHAPSELSFNFLSGVLGGSDPSSIRKECAFWLGESNPDRALPLLEQTAEKDRAREVRENAIFAISEIKSEKALETLIKLAREGDDIEMRKKAMFWLGEKASKKATAALKDLTYNGQDTEIQKSALYALTQQNDDENIDLVIKVAKTHPNPKVRKAAIYWLGESGNERALNALVEILHN
jgi:hypothetical protein